MQPQQASMKDGDRRRIRQAIRFIFFGLLSFFLCLFISVLILPEGLWTNRGFSYYGDMDATVWLYRLAFLLCGIFLLLAAKALPARMPFAIVRIACWILFPLLVGIVLTTVPNNPALARIHRGIGVTLFIAQLLLDSWLALVVCRDRYSRWLFSLLLLGAVMSLLGVLNIVPYLLESQTIFLLVFGTLLLYSLFRLNERMSPAPHGDAR